VAQPSTTSCRYRSLHGRIFPASASFEKSVKRRSGPVRAPVVGELGAGVDVELLADVEVGLGVGDTVVHPVELRIVDDVDPEHEDEVVGDDILLEMGSGLPDLEEPVELLLIVLGV